MISPDVASATDLKTRLLAVTDLGQLPSEVEDLCLALSDTIIDPDFPGVLVPVATGPDEVTVLMACRSQRQWRLLSPLLKAFAGPTLTSFSGAPGALPSGLAAASVLLSEAPATTAVLRVPADRTGTISALRALLRMRETLGKSPDLSRNAIEPTGWMLASFQDHLNTNRFESARAILVRLRDEMRLDALNLAALEVQLRAATGDWIGITQLAVFPSLTLARRTRATTGLLLEALYQVFLRDLFEAEDPAVHDVYADQVRALAQPMLNSAVPSPARVGAWRLMALEAQQAPDREDLRQSLSTTEVDLGWLAVDDVSASVDDVANQSDQSLAETRPAPLDIAREALSQNASVESLDAVGAALAALARLGPDEVARLRAAEPFSLLLRGVEIDASTGALPDGWAAWFDASANPAFTNAIEVARLGQEEWSIAAVADDPVHIQNLMAAIERSQNNPIATERTTLALPYLVAWLRADDGFPKASFAPIYSILLTLFVLAPTLGRQAYASSQVLIQGLLASGVSAQAYRSLISDVEEIAGDGFGVDMSYWLLEVAEDFMRAAAPDAQARTEFLHSMLARLAPLYWRLSSLQRAIVDAFAHELGWSLSSLGVGAQPALPAGPASPADPLDGKRIAIYTLTEATARQAKAAIERASPGATVDVNSDYGGTPTLKALAENSDLFVMVWQSAKHAATDYIREHRGDKPLLYAAGRGVSSILRSIEDHLAQA